MSDAPRPPRPVGGPSDIPATMPIERLRTPGSAQPAGAPGAPTASEPLGDGSTASSGDPAAPTSGAPGAADAPLPPRRRRTPGVLALVLVVVAVLAEAAALTLATADADLAGYVLAVVAIGASVAALVVGLVAAILGRGRGLGAVAAVLAVIANPLVQLIVLTAVGSRS